MRSWTKAVPLPILALAIGVASCGGDNGGLPGQCGLDFSGTVDSSFGDARIDALLETTGRFSVAATEIDTSVREACNAICTDLGAETGEDTQTACTNARTAIEGVLAASASVSLTVEYVPAVCSIDAQASLACTAECDAGCDVDAQVPTCEGGELSGTCSGQCSGSCTV